MWLHVLFIFSFSVIYITWWHERYWINICSIWILKRLSNPCIPVVFTFIICFQWKRLEFRNHFVCLLTECFFPQILSLFFFFCFLHLFNSYLKTDVLMISLCCQLWVTNVGRAMDWVLVWVLLWGCKKHSKQTHSFHQIVCIETMAYNPLPRQILLSCWKFLYLNVRLV